MAYFKKLLDEKTYSGATDDFHFIYNANTGGGQSFLGGRFYDRAGHLTSPSALNGRLAVFKFVIHSPAGAREIPLSDPEVQYDIKPRAAGDNNMKFGVGTKPTPNSAVAAFLMLPEPCGVKCSVDINAPILSKRNFWVHSMWLNASTEGRNKAELVPRDCVICGGVDKQGGTAKYYSVDIERRMQSIINFSCARELDDSIRAHLKFFADIYLGVTQFSFASAVNEINTLMQDLAVKFPDLYAGATDPLLAIIRVMMKNLQRISYGAPGTGKSYGVNEVAEKLPSEDVVRTTFHPDSDYSTFVGAYKPTMAGDKIAYKFVPQAFTKAYVQAWRRMAAPEADGNAAPVMLVIEEINRGNCAQIFGDLFQLLDRGENGYSEYPIEADEDLGKWLAEQFDAIPGHETLPPDVVSGKQMMLPPNLYIWATMNTSDQSLFPIDNAFKRRWDWVYVPITEGKDKSGKKLDWKIAFSNGHKYGWWNFLKTVNARIQKATSSEDKKLGYFFAKADAAGEISAERFLNKVVFYLWNDVFKDYGLKKIFSENGEDVEFQRFFVKTVRNEETGKDEEVEGLNEELLEKFLSDTNGLGLAALAPTV